MKKIFFFLLFALSALSLRAQLLENDTAFYAYGFVDNLASTLDNEYILNVTDFVGGLLPYANTTFEETDIDTGFIVWHNCQRFKITEVSSTSPLVLQVYDLGENRPLIEGTSGRIMILKEKPGGLPQGISTTGDGPGVTTGVAPDYYACILSFYLRRLAGITSTSGGDVTGPLSNLQIVANAVGTSELATDGVGTAEIAAGAVGSSELNQQSATTGQVLKWDGAAWTPGTDATGGGGVTDGDKGDITVTASGATWTVDNLAILTAEICGEGNVTFSTYSGPGKAFTLGTPPFDYASDGELAATSVDRINPDDGGSWSMLMASDSVVGVYMGITYDSLADRRTGDWNYSFYYTGEVFHFRYNGDDVHTETYSLTYSPDVVARMIVSNDTVYFNLSLDGGATFSTLYTWVTLADSAPMWPQYYVENGEDRIYLPQQSGVCETAIGREVRLYLEQHPAGDGDDQTAAQVPCTPDGFSYSNVQSALAEIAGLATAPGTAYWTEGSGANFRVFTVGASNNFAVIEPTGTGGFMLDTDGGTRGDNSVDLQMDRTSSDQIASGLRSTLLAGYASKASETNTVAGGYDSWATAANAFATGAGASAPNVGQFSRASGSFDTRGDAQMHTMQFRREITGTAQTELFLGPSANTERAAISSNNMWVCHIQVVATTKTVGNGTGTLGDSFFGEYSVGIKRVSNTTSLVGTPASILTPFSDTSMATIGVAFVADDTNEALAIKITPPATAGSTSVYRTVSTSYCTEVGY